VDILFDHTTARSVLNSIWINDRQLILFSVCFERCYHVTNIIYDVLQHWHDIDETMTDSQSKIRLLYLIRVIKHYIYTTHFSRSESPLISGSLHRFHTPSPQAKSSPGRFVRTPISANMSSAEQSISADMMESLIPDICIDHLWTETGNVPRYILCYVIVHQRQIVFSD